MSVPSKNFTTINDTAVDVDSPLDETLMTAYRDRDQHNYEWIGYGFTPNQAHNHDGVNSVLLSGNIMAAVFSYSSFL